MRLIPMCVCCDLGSGEIAAELLLYELFDFIFFCRAVALVPVVTPFNEHDRRVKLERKWIDGIRLVVGVADVRLSVELLCDSGRAFVGGSTIGKVVENQHRFLSISDVLVRDQLQD